MTLRDKKSPLILNAKRKLPSYVSFIDFISRKSIKNLFHCEYLGNKAEILAPKHTVFEAELVQKP